MEILNKITKPFRMMKAFYKFNKTNSQKYRSEKSKVLDEEDRRLALDVRQANKYKRQLEDRRLFLEKQAEIKELEEEVGELEYSIYGDEEEERQNNKPKGLIGLDEGLSIEELLMKNLFQAMQQPAQPQQPQNKGFGYPTGTNTNESIIFKAGETEEPLMSDEEIIKNLSLLSDRDKKMLKTIPPQVLTRANQILNTQNL